MKTIWKRPDGSIVACTEKIKVLRENLEELRQMAQAVIAGAAREWAFQIFLLPLNVNRKLLFFRIQHAKGNQTHIIRIVAQQVFQNRVSYPTGDRLQCQQRTHPHFGWHLGRQTRPNGTLAGTSDLLSMP